MSMNIYGGGAKTNINGLRFEQVTSLSEALSSAGYIVNSDGYVHQERGSKPIALSAPKHKLYSRILKPKGVNWKNVISKQLLPDDALFNLNNNTIYIIEKKFQSGPGSVDEKLQTCQFKKMQYERLFKPVDIGVEYIYVCNDWFQQPQYKDVREYIVSVGCHIYFNEIPVEILEL